MGKYMRKSKTTRGEVGLLEPLLGVRTRAKTLALAAAAGGGGGGGSGGGSYLQLRNRRLEKTQLGFDGKRQKHPLKDPNLPKCPPAVVVVVKNQSSRTRQGLSWNSGSEEKKEEEICKDNEVGIEGSFGENLLEFEARERTTRESTPCSLIRDPDNIRIPGSSTRPTNASEANSSIPNSTRGHIPTAHEMNDFFTGPEEQQQQQFIEKYNFDPVNEKPLPGRYEWEKVDL